MAIYAGISLIQNNTVDGWAIVTLFGGFALSGLFVVLCMIVRYQTTLVRLNFLKRDYVFESIDKLQK